ncbi:MAG: RNase adapter RapZ [Alphaproteobacteria bacterium]
MSAGARTRLVLVTGMSGAGRSTALAVLEDAGFEAVDNLPLNLVERVAEPGPDAPGLLAIGVDVRSRGFEPERIAAICERLRANPGLDLQLLFLDCEDEVLIRRFTETRRRHPLAHDRPAADGIAVERRLLAPLRDLADLVIDTGQQRPAELRKRLLDALAPDVTGLTLTVQSFSFKQGVPREADLVFDVRFLRNPHYDPVLRPKTGQDADVGAYVAADPAFAGFFERLTGLLLPLLPRYREEGKSYLTICIGCTGGRHRSVYVAGLLADALRAADWPVALTHRDLAAG